MSLHAMKVIRNAAILILATIILTAGCSSKPYQISGTITGTDVEDVEVHVFGTATFVLSDADGEFAIGNLVGTKKIVPQKEGYEFTPSERTVNGPSTTIDFLCSEVEETYNVSGTITGAGISGVTLTVLGKGITTTSDAGGHYSLLGLADENTIIPSKPGYTYTPTQRVVTGATTSADFVGTEAGGGSSIIMITGGDGHTLAIDEDGTLLSTGYNSSGQLGNDSDEDTNEPVVVSGITFASDIAAGEVHSAAIVNGHLYTWGNDTSGQLGIGGIGAEVWVPAEVTGITDAVFVDVACGSDHTIALTDDGEVYTWGDNDYSQLGRAVDESHPSNLPGVVNLASFLPDVPIGVYAGDALCLVLMDDGGMVGWGANYYGELGLGPGQPNIIATPRAVLISDVEEVSTGYYHTIVRKSNGELFIWGYNWDGQIGDGTNIDCPTPKHLSGFDNALSFLAAGLSSFVVNSSGEVYAWGNNSSSYLGTGESSTKIYSPTQVQNLADIEVIYGGYDYTFAFETDGTMWGWGNNGDGQLGDTTWTSRPLPVQITW